MARTARPRRPRSIARPRRRCRPWATAHARRRPSVSPLDEGFDDLARRLPQVAEGVGSHTGWDHDALGEAQFDRLAPGSHDRAALPVHEVERHELALRGVLDRVAEFEAMDG